MLCVHTFITPLTPNTTGVHVAWRRESLSPNGTHTVTFVLIPIEVSSNWSDLILLIALIGGYFYAISAAEVIFTVKL